MNPTFDKRDKCGEFHTLFPVLLEQASKFLSIILKKLTFQCKPFFYSKDDLKMQTRQSCVQHEATRHTGIHGWKKTK
jgi:hypothetical protein